MRCSCCNHRLSDYETTLKHVITGAYLDTCLDCLSEIAHEVPMPVKGRREFLEHTLCEKDLIANMDIPQELDKDEDTLYNNYKDNLEDD